MRFLFWKKKKKQPREKKVVYQPSNEELLRLAELYDTFNANHLKEDEARYWIYVDGLVNGRDTYKAAVKAFVEEGIETGSINTNVDWRNGYPVITRTIKEVDNNEKSNYTGNQNNG